MKRIINMMPHWLKLRLTLKPFDIYKETICSRNKSDDYWIGYDNKVYYGMKWFIIKSAQKSFKGKFINHE